MKVVIEKQDDGTYIAYNIDGEQVGLIGTGETIEEAKEDFYNSINEVKEDFTEMGHTVPSCLNETISFKIDIC